MGQIVAEVQEGGVPASGPPPGQELIQRFIAVDVTKRVTSTYAEPRYVLGCLVIVELYRQPFTTYNAASNDLAASKSFCVIPPSLCVDSVSTTSL